MSQPHRLSEPSAVSAAQSRSTSAWSAHRIWNETASENGDCRPALRAMNRLPASVNSTMRTVPAGPLGVSVGDRVTRSIRESGSSET